MIDSKIDDLREEFGPERLPVDFGGVDPSTEAIGLLENRPFVEQLKLIGLGPTGQKMAIVDYFRAREQRSRWARDGLLRQNELTDYGRQLDIRQLAVSPIRSTGLSRCSAWAAARTG